MNWDAYEAPAGRPLLELMPHRQPWSEVRFWLLDLAQELLQAEKEGSVPSVLSLDQIWITGDGCAQLLDFPAPGLSQEVLTGATPTATAGLVPPRLSATNPGAILLAQVAHAALTGRVPSSGPAAWSPPPVPLPLCVRAFLSRLAEFSAMESIVAALQPLLTQAANISRMRRLGLVTGCLAVPSLAGLSLLFGLQMMKVWERQLPGLFELSTLLSAHQPGGGEERSLGIYIAARYRGLITNSLQWNSALATALIQGERRRFAEQSVTEHPEPAGAEVEEASRALQPFSLNR